MTRTLALLIPAYNAVAYLPRLLESAAHQSEPFDEIWVYDDFSTDDTAMVARRHGANVVRGGSRQGCTVAKSYLVNQTTCDWIHFHDADDVLLPNFVVTAKQWMAHNEAEVVVFGCEERWADTGELISVSDPDDSLLASDPLGYTIRYKINAISGIYNRASFLRAGGFDLDPDVHYNEDQACHCRLADAGIRFRGEPTITVVNLRRQSSMWTCNQSKALRAHYHVMRKILANPGAERHKDLIAERLWHVVAGAASQLDWRTADEAAVLAMHLAGASKAPASLAFKTLCRISPHFALRIREGLIRTLKPHHRKGYPGWRARISLI